LPAGPVFHAAQTDIQRVERHTLAKGGRGLMSITTILVIVLIVFLLGGGGFYWSRRG
jgi:hypothetical protein